MNERYALLQAQKAKLLAKPSRLDADDDGEWITVNGAHIHLSEEGSVDKGPSALKKTFTKKPGSGKKTANSSGKQASKSENKTVSKARSAEADRANESMRKVAKDRDSTRLKAAVTSTLEDLQLGASFTQNGVHWVKIGEDSYLSDNKFTSGGEPWWGNKGLIAMKLNVDDPGSIPDIEDVGDATKFGKSKPLPISAPGDITIEKKGKVYFARGENGFAVSSGTDQEAVKKKAKQKTTKWSNLTEGFNPGEMPEHSETYESFEISTNPYNSSFINVSKDGKVVGSYKAHERQKAESWIKKQVDNFGPVIGMKSGEKRAFNAHSISKEGFDSLISSAATGTKVRTWDGSIYEKSGDSWTRYANSYWADYKQRTVSAADVVADYDNLDKVIYSLDPSKKIAGLHGSL